MTYRRMRGLFFAIAVLAVLASSGRTARAQGEAKMRVITTWNAGCSGATRSSWDNMVDGWYDEITNDLFIPIGHGPYAWARSGRQGNGTIVDSDFADCGTYAWGNDCNRTDSADALMVGLHGGNSSGNHQWYGKVRIDEAGTGNCYAWQGHMEFGDLDLEFLHLSSCVSIDREDWWPEWSSSFDGLHQVDGFHGIMWIYSGYVSRYRDFADDSFWMSIADAWLDDLYVNNANDSYDQCPVARNVGINSSDTLVRMCYERYNNVFAADPPGLGTSRSHRARYIRGCDPKGGDPLP